MEGGQRTFHSILEILQDYLDLRIYCASLKLKKIKIKSLS
jgi:hypothetical protein